jgi:hypothetical protein
LPAVCGRVCPQETQCEQKCVRGIKESRSQSAGWSALSPIGITSITRERSQNPAERAPCCGDRLRSGRSDLRR